MLENFEPGLLDLRGVVVVDNVDPDDGISSLQQARDAYEREYILKKIEEARNNISHAAELLGLERSHLYRKMKALGIGVRE